MIAPLTLRTGTQPAPLEIFHALNYVIVYYDQVEQLLWTGGWFPALRTEANWMLARLEHTHFIGQSIHFVNYYEYIDLYLALPEARNLFVPFAHSHPLSVSRGLENKSCPIMLMVCL